MMKVIKVPVSGGEFRWVQASAIAHWSDNSDGFCRINLVNGDEILADCTSEELAKCCGAAEVRRKESE